MRTLQFGPLFTCMMLLTACTAKPTNPSFPTTFSDANRAIGEMRASPCVLRRPLVIIGGMFDPNVSPPLYRMWFERVTRDSQVITVSVGLCGSFDECRRKVIYAVQAKCPSSDPEWTSEVDVVGASLGGLIGRYAAAPSKDPAHSRRLRIARLFSISSPHSGANLAKSMAITQFHRDMRPGSNFLLTLAGNDSEANYSLYPYVRLNDEIVGERFAAPPGVTPLWLPNPRWMPSHSGAMCDERILADIARRLRGEEPLSHAPATTPLPEPS